MIKINISIVLAFFILNGCARSTASKAAPGQQSVPKYVISNSDDKKLVSINSLLVAPVFVNSSVSAGVPSNLNLNEMLSRALQEELQIKIAQSERTAGLGKSAVSSEFADVAQYNRINSEYLSDAKKMNLDGVLITKINNFDSRVGSEVGSTVQARVDMAMQIINTNTRQIVWQSTYHYKDAALTDNLFKIKDRLAENKPKFRSAEELLAEGYRNSIRDFSQKRLSGFVR